MSEFILAAEPGAGTGDHSVELYLATVGASDSTGVTLIFDGASAATTKRFKCVGSRPGVGDRVAVMKQSGTYIVLGAISAAGSGGSEETEVITTISDICTSSSDFTVTEAKFAHCGKVASFIIKGTWNNTTTSTGWITVCTMKAGKRPPLEAAARAWLNTNAYLYPNGNLYFYGTITQGNSATFTSTYLLA